MIHSSTSLLALCRRTSGSLWQCACAPCLVTSSKPTSCQGTRNCQLLKMGVNTSKSRSNSSNTMHNNKGDIRRGLQCLLDNQYYKGLAISARDRDAMGLRGLLPPAVRSPELQVDAVLKNLARYQDDLSRYLHLRHVQDSNERLFYRVLCEHTEQMMPLVYTPTVGDACIEYSLIYARPKGLYISVHDAGHIYEILGNWPEKDIKAIVVTDGERILGLGDLGANGMGIPVGKLSLYTALAGFPPHLTIPVTIDVGTNNEKLLSDPLYIGLKQKRVRGPEFDDLIQEFMEAVVKRYGKSCLIQFEDFGNQNAFRLLDKYKENYCTFNDDIQGTASVALAGILASLKITGQKLAENMFLFQGAGEAALGTADLLVMAMEKEGLSKEDARKRIWLADSKGLIVKERPSGGMTEHKERYAKEGSPIENLEDMVEFVKPTAIIGVSAQFGSFTDAVLKKMAAISEQPIIFALSNPTSKAECTAEQAYINTEGRCIFASGSPFDPVQYNGKTYYPGQGNNAYIFPGIGLAVMACEVHRIPEEVFLVSANALADLMTQEYMDEGRVYPPLSTIHDVSLKIAAKVSQYFFKEGLAMLSPEPEDKIAFLKSKQYDYTYGSESSNGQSDR